MLVERENAWIELSASMRNWFTSAGKSLNGRVVEASLCTTA